MYLILLVLLLVEIGFVSTAFLFGCYSNHFQLNSSNNNGSTCEEKGIGRKNQQHRQVEVEELNPSVGWDKKNNGLQLISFRFHSRCHSIRTFEEALRHSYAGLNVRGRPRYAVQHVTKQDSGQRQSPCIRAVHQEFFRSVQLAVSLEVPICMYINEYDDINSARMNSLCDWNESWLQYVDHSTEYQNMFIVLSPLFTRIYQIFGASKYWKQVFK